MVFSDTTNKNGLIQTFEFWTRMPDGTVAGTLLKQVTNLINSAFDDIMPLLIGYSDHIRWDDPNHTSHRPIGTMNLVSGQADYTLGEDEDSLDILNLLYVRILQTSTATEYDELTKMMIDDPNVQDAMSPNPSNSGIPSHWLEVNNTLYLYPEPNFSATNGIKLFYEREQHYFVSTDTDAEPGIPKPFHELLALKASLSWNMVNRTTDTPLISRLEARIAKKESELKKFIDLKHPVRKRITMSGISFR